MYRVAHQPLEAMQIPVEVQAQRAFRRSLILERWPFMRPARALSPCAVDSAIQVSHVVSTVCFWSLHGDSQTLDAIYALPSSLSRLKVQGTGSSTPNVPQRRNCGAQAWV